ncbi:interferon-induced protein 44 [Etheostoma spectabile]|uniref:interferon-induced protein 44 n=1 Tax=Etheostoma spectabile TaxID=54343 RepID=UPI0013AE978A|nr:interferon-induced protein 44-like [Etheostoma spectabile]
MGGSSSSPAPPPSPLLSVPWRTITWADKQSDLQHVKNYKPQTDGQQLRILLYGSVGAGKSSFINSVTSVIKGQMSKRAGTANVSGSSYTKKYTTYRIQKDGQNTFHPVVLSDTMGMECSTNRRRKVYVKDMKRAMKGHVRDGYTFNPECKILKDDQRYIPAPTANDRAHVLVCVVDARTVSQMSEKAIETLQDIRDEASDLNIPQVAILTKIDLICPEIQKDLRNVYKSKILKQKMEEFSAEVGIPVDCIFPVKNYHDDNTPDNDADTLILSALRSFINLGDDFISGSPSKDRDFREHPPDFNNEPTPI